MLAWHQRQEEPKKQVSKKKKIANLAMDPPKKNKDVDALKAMGGPFTSPHAVNEYV